MSILAISDLHLALSVDKPMDVFGGRWSDYMDKLKICWEEVINDEDYVIIPGDISWATYLEDVTEDFAFLDKLPGKKIILKGNHDYWWTTYQKLNKFLQLKGFSTLSFVHNNGYICDGVAICGTRGWKCPGEDDFSLEDEKIYKREVNRLELSLRSIAGENYKEIVVALHYPPINNRNEVSDFVEIMKKYKVTKCIYGHLHGEGHRACVEGQYGGIDFSLVSADYLNFRPLKLDF